MNFLKELTNKTWIDWLKIVVAIDIAGVGVGLILGFNLHVFASMLGFITRIIFGVLYVFVAVLIFKRVFPQALATEEHLEAKHMDEEIRDTAVSVKDSMKKMLEKAGEIAEKAQGKIDQALDKGEQFVGKRKQEINDEVNKLMNDDRS